MRYNYPIKYAAMPIIEQVGWSHGLHELERNYDVVYYIVSKCYLLNDKTKYKENGKIEKEYEVIFPYQKGQYSSWLRAIPEFNIYSNDCTNSCLVEKVFDSYEEALEVVTQKNKKLSDKKKREEFNKRFSKYKVLEQQILVNTSDLEQSNVKELNELIINSEGKTKVLSNSLYEYLKWILYSKFIVYSISLEQHDKLVTLINNQDISNISKIIENATPILYHDAEKDIMVIDQVGNVLYYVDEWENLEKNNEQKIPPIKLNAIDDEIKKIFTTETLEDIVLSFKGYKSINLNEIQGPILKKTKK